MAREPLELPPIPPTDCDQAQFTKILLDQEVAEYNSLKLGDTEVGGLYVVNDELLEGRGRRLSMATDFLIEYVSSCTNCDAPAGSCPLKGNFDFIIERLVAINESDES